MQRNDKTVPAQTHFENGLYHADLIKKPPHYTFGRFEVIDVLMDWFPDRPLLWQVGKYLARCGRKGDPIQDLEKARFYLDREIERLGHERFVEGNGDTTCKRMS